MINYNQSFMLLFSSSSKSPDQKMSLKISGPEVGYALTSTCVIAAASTILDDKLING